jgi:RND family efflux transporter MFP subunit
VAVGITRVNIAFKREPNIDAPQQPLFVTETTRAIPETVNLTIKTSGVVQPWLETKLASQISGRIIELCDCFANGNNVKEGSVLLKIDATDFEANVAQAKQSLAQARVNFFEEQARVEQAEDDWQTLKLGAPTDLALRKPQLAAAQAQVERRKAELSKALRDLSQTTLRAPYDGVITAREVALGDYIQVGAGIGRLINNEKFEVRLPVTLNDASKINDRNQEVLLKANLNDAEIFWPATIVRSEAEIDTKSRMVNLVAQINEPLNTNKHSQPLRTGTFVNADIQLDTSVEAFRVPLTAIDASGRLMAVDADNRVVPKAGFILEVFGSEAYIKTEELAPFDLIRNPSGLKPGMQVVASSALSADYSEE